MGKSKRTWDSSEDRGREQSAPASGAKEPMKRKDYEQALRDLQVDLCALQEWVKHKGLRVVVVFEGRDAAGKGGVIAWITPPLPAASRPSNTTTTRKPLCLTHSCNAQRSTCNSRKACS